MIRGSRYVRRISLQVRFKTIILVAVIGLLSFCVIQNPLASAAVGINKQMSFQGKVVNTNGTNVTDASYTFKFRIYTSTSGDTATPCAATCIWEETKSITTVNSIFQTNLGDTTTLPGSVDFNSDTLYLAVIFNGDTEMTPRIRLTAVPYAFNADKLDGLDATAFAQLSPGSQQTGSLNVSGGITSGGAVQGTSGTFTASSALTLGTASSIAGTILFRNGTNANVLTLASGVSGSNFQLTLPTALGASGDCLKDTTGAGVLGFGSCGSGGGSYITNGTGLQTSANFNIQALTSGVSGTIGGIIRGASGGQTADLLQFQSTAGAVVAKVDAGGNILSTGVLTISGTGNSSIMGPLGLGTTNPQTASAFTVANGAWMSSLDAAGTGYINAFAVNSSNQIQVGAALSIDGGIILPTNGGQITLVDLGIDSTATSGTKQSYTFRLGSQNAMTVYGEADGAGNPQNVRVAIGTSISPSYTLDVGGDVNLSTGSALRINGTSICTSAGCTSSGGGGSDLQAAYTASSSPATITETAGKGVRIVAGAAPTTDMFTIDNTGQGVATSGVSGLQINYVGGALNGEASAARIDYTPGTTSGGVWNGLRIVANATGPVSGVTAMGIKLEGPTTAGAGLETGIYVGTGWDTGLDVQSGGLNLKGIVDSGGLPSDPATPAANNLKFYAKNISGRLVPKWKGPSGVDTPVQAALWSNNIAAWFTNGTVNGLWLGTSGVGASTVNTPVAPTTTNLYTSVKRHRYSTVVTTTNQQVGQRSTENVFYRGGSTGQGGFFFFARFGIDAWTAGDRLFVGMNPGTTAVVTANPSALTNVLGFGIDAADTAITFMHNDGSGTAVKDTIAGQPTLAANQGYDAYIFAKPNDTVIYYRLVNINTGAVIIDTSTSTDLPVNTTMMAVHALMSNAANTPVNAAQLGLNRMYVETDL